MARGETIENTTQRGICMRGWQQVFMSSSLTEAEKHKKHVSVQFLSVWWRRGDEAYSSCAALSDGEFVFA